MPADLPPRALRRQSEHQQIRAQIMQEANPVNFLAKVMRGNPAKLGGETPTLSQRLKAAEKLLDKCLPDLKSTDLVADVNHNLPEEGAGAYERIVGRLGRLAGSAPAGTTTH